MFRAVASDEPKNRRPRAERIPPQAALPDLVERVVSKRRIHAETGDVIITQKRTPALNPKALAPPPWQYQIGIFGQPSNTRDQTFTTFTHAASHAETLASQLRRRVLYLESGTASLLADYRR